MNEYDFKDDQSPQTIGLTFATWLITNSIDSSIEYYSPTAGHSSASVGYTAFVSRKSVLRVLQNYPTDETLHLSSNPLELADLRLTQDANERFPLAILKRAEFHNIHGIDFIVIDRIHVFVICNLKKICTETKRTLSHAKIKKFSPLLKKVICVYKETTVDNLNSITCAVSNQPTLIQSPIMLETEPAKNIDECVSSEENKILEIMQRAKHLHLIAFLNSESGVDKLEYGAVSTNCNSIFSEIWKINVAAIAVSTETQKTSEDDTTTNNLQRERRVFKPVRKQAHENQ